MVSVKTYKVLIGVTEHDDRYVIYDAEDLEMNVKTNPSFISNLLNEFASKTWCEAFDNNGKPVWIRTSTIVRIEYKEATIWKS